MLKVSVFCIKVIARQFQFSIPSFFIEDDFCNLKYIGKKLPNELKCTWVWWCTCVRRIIESRGNQVDSGLIFLCKSVSSDRIHLCCRYKVDFVTITVCWQWQWQWKWFYCHELHKSYHTWYTGKTDWRKIEQTFYMHLHIIIWQEEQGHNLQSKPDNTIPIFMTKGAKSMNLWAPISVIMKQEYRGVQKKMNKCESAKKNGLYCRYANNISNFIADDMIMLISYWYINESCTR